MGLVRDIRYRLGAQWREAKRTFIPTPLEQVAIKVVAWTIVVVGAALMVVVVGLWIYFLFR